MLLENLLRKIKISNNKAWIRVSRDAFLTKGGHMNFERIINLILFMIFMWIFRHAEKKAEDRDTSRIFKYLSRTFVIVIFTVSIIALSYYSIFAVEEGPIRRVLSGLMTILMLVYIIRKIKKYITN